MRQVFSSPRLENVEGVAQLLRDAGVEVRITDGRSYKRQLRGDFSYARENRDSPQAAVWVVRSDQQMQARELLREAGLFDSTRGEGTYTMPAFRSVAPTPAGNQARRRAMLMKLGMMAVIAVVLVLGMILTFNRPPGMQTSASPPFDGSVAATLSPVARAVFASELAETDITVACLAVDGRDASAGLVRALAGATRAIVPASECERVADEERGSYHRGSGAEAMVMEVGAFRPSAPDAGQIEFSAYHHRMHAAYKTLEVRRVDGVWQVVRVIKHVRT